MFGLFGMGIAMEQGFGFILRKAAIFMSAPVYRQRDPQSTPYYRCIEDHFETFEQVYDDRFERQYGF
ncbi:MAG: hypothetical protein JRJ46_01260 [Deltaproteobacteria bacterium]|nr:hypothetical protein [Deltaproteobacteria bacterium]